MSVWRRSCGSLAVVLFVTVFAGGCGDSDGDNGGTEPTTDTTAPAAVTTLSATAWTETSITLGWTAPGDDGSTGTAASYDIRYSLSTISGATWASATAVSGEPSPAAAGTGQSYAITGLTDSTRYYFALKTSDEDSNISALSNVVDRTTGAALNINDFWKARLTSDFEPDPGDRGDCVQIVQTGTSLAVSGECFDDGTMSGSLIGDSLYLEDDDDDFVMIGTATNDSVWGRWYDADYEDGEPDSGDWIATPIGRQVLGRDCVVVNADVICVLDRATGKYILAAQLDDHGQIVSSATLTGDLLTGSYELSDTLFPEETDEWWTDYRSADFVISTGAAPTFPLNCTIDIDFSNGASESVDRIVKRYYEVDMEDDGAYAGLLYFPINPDDVWNYSTGTVEVLTETRTFTDGTGRRFELDLVFSDSTDIMFFGYSAGNVAMFGLYDYNADDYADDPVDGLATILLDTMKVNNSWLMPVAGSPDSTRIEFTLLGRIDVTVPAGTFVDCLKIRFRLIDDEEPYTDHLYFAPNVGIVKVERVAPLGATEGFFLLVDSSNRLCELQSATIAGIDYP